MTKPRIVVDNATARAASLTASTTSGALAASNLLIESKDSVWRATGTSATLTLTWTNLESVSCVALPFCNLSPTATIRVRGYSDTGGTTQVLDTTALLACPAPAVSLRGWTAAQAASAYAYGGGTHARVWCTPTNVRRLDIDIADASNLQGYIEAACLVVGAYWSPTYYASAVSVTPVDTTELYRTDSGGQNAEAGYIYKRLSMDLSYMPAADRTTFANMLRNSRAYPIFICLFPLASDYSLERDHIVYGRRTKDSDITLQWASAYSTSVEFEEI